MKRSAPTPTPASVEPQPVKIVPRGVLLRELTSSFEGSKDEQSPRAGLNDLLEAKAWSTVAHRDALMQLGAKVRQEMLNLLAKLESPIQETSLEAIGNEGRARLVRVLTQQGLMEVEGLSELFEFEMVRACAVSHASAIDPKDKKITVPHFITIEELDSALNSAFSALDALSSAEPDVKLRAYYGRAKRELEGHLRISRVSINQDGGIHNADTLNALLTTLRASIRFDKVQYPCDMSRFAQVANAALTDMLHIFKLQYPTMFTDELEVIEEQTEEADTADEREKKRRVRQPSVGESIQRCEDLIAELDTLIKRFNEEARDLKAITKELGSRARDEKAHPGESVVDEDLEFSFLDEREWFPDISKRSGEYKTELVKAHAHLAPYAMMRRSGASRIVELKLSKLQRDKAYITDVVTKLTVFLGQTRTQISRLKGVPGARVLTDRFAIVDGSLPDTDEQLEALPKRIQLPALDKEAMKHIIGAIERLEAEMTRKGVQFESVLQ